MVKKNMVKKKSSKVKKKPLVRFVTLLLGLGFAGSTLAIALSSVFSNQNYSQHAGGGDYPEAPSIEEQIQLQVQGYEKVLSREPENITALEGLAQIYLQTGQPAKAVPILEKIVQNYPENQQYAGLLNAVKERVSTTSAAPETPAAPKN